MSKSHKYKRICHSSPSAKANQSFCGIHHNQPVKGSQRPPLIPGSNILADNCCATILKSILGICTGTVDIVRNTKGTDCDCTIILAHCIDYRLSEYKCYLLHHNRKGKLQHRSNNTFAEYYGFDTKGKGIISSEQIPKGHPVISRPICFADLKSTPNCQS